MWLRRGERVTRRRGGVRHGCYGAVARVRRFGGGGKRVKGQPWNWLDISVRRVFLERGVRTGLMLVVPSLEIRNGSLNY